MSRVIGHKVAVELSIPGAFGLPVENLPASAEREGYLDKLIKYVPAEVTAVAAATFATFDIDGKAIWVTLAALGVLNLAYLAVNAKTTKTRPQWYFYILATVAFVAWAVATVADVAAEFGLGTDAKQAYILGAAAFLIPLAHNGCEAFFTKNRAAAV